MKVNVINVQVKFENKPDVMFGERVSNSAHFKNGFRKSTQMINTLPRGSQEEFDETGRKETQAPSKHQKFLNALTSTAQVHARKLQGQRSQSSVTKSRKILKVI